MRDDLWTIKQENRDPLAIRLSVGMPHEVVSHKDGEVGYIVYRGDPRKCLHVLEQAAKQMRQHVEESEA